MSGRGRGAYYKQKYGRGGARDGGSAGGHGGRGGSWSGGAKRTSSDLDAWLHAHDNRPYPAYHDIEGTWSFEKFAFTLDHAQADPYAAPSKARLKIPHAHAQFPLELYSTRTRRVALADYLLRTVYDACTSKRYDQRLSSGGWSGGKGGQIEVDEPGQQVLERTAVQIDDEGIEVRFLVGLPARGRSIMVCENVPSLAQHALFYSSCDAAHLKQHIFSIEDQDALRGMLSAHGLVGFLPNGAVLARASGASDLPMPSPPCVAFESPKELQVTLTLPNRGKIKGLGIAKKSLYVCLGGGFHGKSTFLSALAYGTYNHIPGDGREFVSVSPSAASIRSEDGRPVSQVDISPFISNLPDGSDTSNASGSTSCAAALMEALELGSDLLIFDEDSTASNFLVRDATMKTLVPDEPITPLVARARDLVEQTGATIALVCGSSSAFLREADVVVQMERYKMRDVTRAAKELVAQQPAPGLPDPALFSVAAQAAWLRTVRLPSLEPRGKVSTRHRFLVQYGDETLDLHAVPQLVHASQTRAIETVLRQWAQPDGLLGRQGMSGAPVAHLRELVDTLERLVEEHGVDALQSAGRHDGFLARPRRVDLGAAGTYCDLCK